ncbi:Retinol dehydrogenase 12 [Durusdinium trenchii]|uniref:Retinol dehydrogenase 12 n=2 Tax=Durusdinium trenchii TaxID=1381693 RepID=A0ABP0RWI7_9DINO
MRKSALGISAILGVALLFEPWWRRWRAERRLKELLEEHVGAEGRVVITGADRGIGKELARLLRHSRVSLLLGCLSTSAAEAGSDAKTAISNLELLDFDSVQRFAEEAHEFLREGKPGLRMLVNNAGYKERHEGDRTKYGTGRTWQINFLGPFLLTEFLARRRERDEVQYPASVINVASGHESESNLNKVLLDSLEG